VNRPSHLLPPPGWGSQCEINDSHGSGLDQTLRCHERETVLLPCSPANEMSFLSLRIIHRRRRKRKRRLVMPHVGVAAAATTTTRAGHRAMATGK
jgi:hypothetical protein